MEIYKDLSSPASQQFEKLLNNQLSKNKIEEGKVIEGKITKITEKYIFLFIQGLKSEPVIDINEMKMIGMQNKIAEGEKISVLLEKIEDKNGDVIVSAQKAKKIKGWYKLEKAYEDNESINGKITSKCKGGVIVEHVETGSLMFCPGSQISDKPMKNIDHLIGVEQKFAIIKLDKLRGNACVSRRQIVSSNKKEDKAKIVEKFKVGDIVACGGSGHAEIISVPKNLCSKVPSNVKLEEAAFTTIASIAMQGIRQADVRLGESIAVIGLGLV